MPNITHQFFVKADSKKVFDTFCTPQGLNAWWTLESDGKPELGNNYRLYFSPEYDWNAKVVHVKNGFELTWQMTKAMDDWMPTQVGFILTEKSGGTTVNFFHTNWKEANDHYAITNFCWGQLLNGLKNFIEKGIVIPFDKRN